MTTFPHLNVIVNNTGIQWRVPLATAQTSRKLS